MAIDAKLISSLGIEDYVAIKRKAYDFAQNNLSNNNYFRDVQSYIIDVLDLELTQIESLIFSATALYPYDLEFCELYKEKYEEYLKFKKNNIVLRDKFELKELEIEMFHLDKLIEEGILTPLSSTEQKNNENSIK